MGGIFPTTEERCGAVIRRRMPYIGSVGALDMVNFGPRETVSERYAGRLLYQHNPQVTLMGTTPEENARMGRWIGEQLNAMGGPVRSFLPEGVSPPSTRRASPSRTGRRARRCSHRLKRPSGRRRRGSSTAFPTTSTRPSSPPPSSRPSGRCTAQSPLCGAARGRSGRDDPALGDPRPSACEGRPRGGDHRRRRRHGAVRQVDTSNNCLAGCC